MNHSNEQKQPKYIRPTGEGYLVAKGIESRRRPIDLFSSAGSIELVGADDVVKSRESLVIPRTFSGAYGGRFHKIAAPKIENVIAAIPLGK